MNKLISWGAGLAVAAVVGLVLYGISHSLGILETSAIEGFIASTAILLGIVVAQTLSGHGEKYIYIAGLILFIPLCGVAMVTEAVFVGMESGKIIANVLQLATGIGAFIFSKRYFDTRHAAYLKWKSTQGED